MSWDGGQCGMDAEKERDAGNSKKRASDDEYDEEYDKGKVGKILVVHAEGCTFGERPKSWALDCETSYLFQVSSNIFSNIKQY